MPTFLMGSSATLLFTCPKRVVSQETNELRPELRVYGNRPSENQKALFGLKSDADCSAACFCDGSSAPDLWISATQWLLTPCTLCAISSVCSPSRANAPPRSGSPTA